MTDFHDIRYGKVSRSNNNHDFIYEASISFIKKKDEYLLNYLTKLFTNSPSQFDFSRLERLPENIRIHNTLLGTGANSMAFNCFINNDELNQYALKINNKPVDKEISVYKKLYGNKYNIIQVHQYAMLFLHPPGIVISTENLLINLDIVWEQIKQAHRNNI